MGEKLRGKLGTIFYVGVIPILFTIIFAAISLNFFGIPVWKTFQEWGNKLPVIHNIIPNPKPALAEDSGDIDYWKEQYSISEGQLKEMDQKIGELNNQLDSNQNDLEVIKKENDTLQKQLENKKTQEVQDQLKEVASIYELIPDSKAAAMLGSMPLDEASLTISLLKQDQQSSILGRMKDAKKAAQITMMLKEIAMFKGTDQTALKEQIHELALQQESPKDTLAETIAGMPAVHSATIIQSMMETSSKDAMELMGNISTTSRSQILTEIAKLDAKLAATIAGNLH